MASSRAIATALATFAETFPTRDLSATTADVWERVFSSVDDETLGRAVLRICRDPERRFFPSTGEVFSAIAADARGVDPATIIHRIEKLGHYEPSRGWVYPNYETIRQELGEEIAKAYSVAGSTALFADAGKDGNTVTRDIARRAFGEELERVNRATPERLRLMPSTPAPLPAIEPPRERAPLMLKPGQKTPLMDTVKAVVAEITVEDKESAA